MTVAEKRAKKAYKEDLIKQGIDKELAEIMAKTSSNTRLSDRL